MLEDGRGVERRAEVGLAVGAAREAAGANIDLRAGEERQRGHSRASLAMREKERERLEETHLERLVEQPRLAQPLVALAPHLDEPLLVDAVVHVRVELALLGDGRRAQVGRALERVRVAREEADVRGEGEEALRRREEGRGGAEREVGAGGAGWRLRASEREAEEEGRDEGQCAVAPRRGMRERDARGGPSRR